MQTPPTSTAKSVPAFINYSSFVLFMKLRLLCKASEVFELDFIVCARTAFVGDFNGLRTGACHPGMARSSS